MKKLLLPLLAVVLFTACKKEISNDKAQEEIAGAANRTSPKITIWHYDASTGKWKQISINETAWSEHQTHGDIRQIGDDYQGGKIAYILQSGDPGYNANVPHGLIAAPSDQNTLAPWGCYGLNILTGTALGTGNQNTNDIMTGCTTTGIAAQICGDLVLNGHTDWYLPSKDELNKLYINRVAIDGFNSGYYWSSSAHFINSSIYAWYQYFGPGDQSYESKSNSFYVRAVRAF